MNVLNFTWSMWLISTIKIQFRGPSEENIDYCPAFTPQNWSPLNRIATPLKVPQLSRVFIWTGLRKRLACEHTAHLLSHFAAALKLAVTAAKPFVSIIFSSSQFSSHTFFLKVYLNKSNLCVFCFFLDHWNYYILELFRCFVFLVRLGWGSS